MLMRAQAPPTPAAGGTRYCPAGPGREAAAANGAGNGAGNGNRNRAGAAVRSRTAPGEGGPAAPTLQVSGRGAAVACAGRGAPSSGSPPAVPL